MADKAGEKDRMLTAQTHDEASSKTGSGGRISWRMELIGFTIGVVAMVFDTTSSTCVRFLQEAVPDLQKNGFRFTAMLLMVAPYFACKRRLPVVKDSGGWIWVASWSIFGTVSVLVFYTSLVFISLGYNAVTFRIAYIFLTMVTSVACLKVKILKVEVIGVILSVAGAILIFQRDIFHNHQENNLSIRTLSGSYRVNGTLLESGSYRVNGTLLESGAYRVNGTLLESGSYRVNGTLLDSKDWNKTERVPVQVEINDGHGSSDYIPPPYNLSDQQALLVGLLLTVAGAITEFGHVALQKIKLQESDIMDLCFWYSLIGMTSSFLLSAIFETMTTPQTTCDWLLLLAHCFCSASFAVMITAAQKFASIITVSLAMGTDLVFYFLSQYLIFKDISNGIGKYIEVSGFLVTLVASFMPPVYELITEKPFNKI